MKLATCFATIALVAAMASNSFAQITGKISLDGKAPEQKEIDMAAVKECASQHPDPVMEETVVSKDGGLANVIVSIKKEEGQELNGEAPKEPVVLDQRTCMYTPHVIACMTGQEFIVKNDDPFMHNVHSLPQINPTFNFAQNNKGDEKKVEPMKAAEYFHIKCDVHPWMSAYVGVFEHPFFAVTKPDGTFELKTKGLADGDYTLLLWHEKYAQDTPVEQKVTVKDGKGKLDYAFKAEAAQASPAGDVQLASSKATVKPCCGNVEQVQRKTVAQAK